MFTPSQQGKYRPIVEAAWKAYATANDLDIKDKPEREAWYKKELNNAIGITSTRGANKGFDFDLAIAHFEGLADDGFYWRGRLRSSILGRIRYASGDKSVSAEYCEGIIRQAHQLDYLPKLEQLNKQDFVFIIRRLKIDLKRR